MPSRRPRPARPPHSAEDEWLLFPQHRDERERARELFDIDIEASLREWIELLAGDRAEAVLRRTPRHTTARRTFARTLDLSKRERQVVTLAAAGYGQRETGGVLGIGYETVRRHRANALVKLGAENVTHAVVLATLLGEIDFDLLREHIFRRWDV